MFMTGNTIIVLGAGATVGGKFRVRINNTDLEPPLDRNFFETPAVQKIFNPDDYPALSYYQQDPSLEATWAKIDLYHKLCVSGVISEEQTYDNLIQKMDRKARRDKAHRIKMMQENRRWIVPSMAGWEILHLIREVYKNLTPPEDVSPLQTLIDALREKSYLRAIISFNYDTSVEEILKNRIHYPLLYSSNEEGALPVIKLHGSLNWQTDTTTSPPIRTLLPSQPRNRIPIADIDHGYGWYKQPEVIGPTFFKQEITLDFEIKGDFRAPYYKRLWSFAWDCIKTAKHVIFVGFSFPQTDFHAAALFRTAHLNGDGFNRVILCHKGSVCLLNTVRKIFKGKPTQFTEFNNGLESLVQRLDGLLALLN